MKKMLLLIALFFLAIQVYSLNADDSRKSDDIVVTTTMEAGPDVNSIQLKRIR
jgi:hypothetical protein